MKNWIITGFVISWVHCSYGAQALIVGEGLVLSMPDYVELSILVDSKCYPTPADARKINDETSRKIVDFLNTKIKIKDNYNSVISSGGYTSSYQTFYQDKYLCQDTFQKQNTITFRTQDLIHFETLFDEIQNTVYRQFSHNSPAIINTAISSVTMTNPTPGVSESLRSQLVLKALNLAYENAMAKLSAIFSTHPVHNLKVTNASELSPTDAGSSYRPMMTPMAMMSGRNEKRMTPAPVQFEQEEINKTIYFTFTFDNIDLSKIAGHPISLR